jgi:DNA primase catalytic core
LAFLEVNRLISERIPIDKIISKYVKLEPTGTGFKGLCPFHKEKTPSFHVNTGEGFYYCFGCQATGNVLTFVMEKEGYSFVDAVKMFAEQYNIKELLRSSFDPDSTANREREEIFGLNKIAAHYFHRSLMKNHEAKEYLSNRGVDDETVVKFGVGFAGSGDEFIKEMNSKGADNNSLRRAGLIKLDSNFRPHSFFYNRIMVPIVSNKKVIGFGGRIFDGDGPKYINSPDTMVFNKKENLFGIDFLREGLKDFPYVVLCEGYFDVIAMHKAGFKTAVAALGTAVTSAHLEIMSRFNKPVVVFLDGDDAGRKAAARITKLSVPDKIDLRVAFIKDEGEDPDSLLLKEGGKDNVRKLIETSRPLFQELIDEQLRIYNGLDNLEEKFKLENVIREIVKAIPRRKFRTYSVYIQQNSGNSIRIMYDREGSVGKLKEKARDDKKTVNGNVNMEESKIKKILVLSSLYPSYVPSINDMTGYFISVNYGTVIEKMVEIYYEGGDVSVILDEIDPLGEISEGLKDASLEFVDKEFLRLRAFLIRTQNERTIELLKKEKSSDASRSVQKLIIENSKLKEIEKDNFVITKQEVK